MLLNHVIVVCDTHDYVVHLYLSHQGYIICAYIHMDGNLHDFGFEFFWI
jgi:hypothetical protein